MKKYIIPVAAFLLIGTIASAQTDKKQPSKMTTKPTTAKPATTGSTKMSKPATKMMTADSTKHTAGTAMKRKTHPKTSAPKKEVTK